MAPRGYPYVAVIDIRSGRVHTPRMAPRIASDLVKQRIRWRIIAKLAEVGFDGITRSALLQSVAKNDYAAGAEVLDSMRFPTIHRDGKKIRLELVTVDALRYFNPKAVEHWFDLSLPAAQAFRQWRLDMHNGRIFTIAEIPTVDINADPQVEVETSPEPEPEPQVDVETCLDSTQGFWEAEDAALAGFWS